MIVLQIIFVAATLVELREVTSVHYNELIRLNASFVPMKADSQLQQSF